MARRSSAGQIATPDRQRLDNILSKLQQPLAPLSLVKVTVTDLSWLCTEAIKVLKRDPILLRLPSPISIIGDLHGQFLDLLEFFKRGGSPPRTSWLFLGDYVDRGPCSVGTFAYLLALKVRFPKNIWLIRGNHETPDISQLYGFFDECERYDGVRLYDRFIEVFRWLPLAAIVNHRIFCVHGGLSQDLKTLNDIEKLGRPLDIPDDGLLSDLLWADPNAVHIGFEPSERGTSFTFGVDVVEEFLQNNDLDLLCRGHQVVHEGYEFPFHPSQCTVTVFSARDYCGAGNKGGMLKVDGALRCTFECLEAVAAVPRVRPLSRCGIPKKRIGNSMKG
jgi:serine/threonine-protein phosphatase PP1 catalytic subunit